MDLLLGQDAAGGADASSCFSIIAPPPRCRSTASLMADSTCDDEPMSGTVRPGPIAEPAGLASSAPARLPQPPSLSTTEHGPAHHRRQDRARGGHPLFRCHSAAGGAAPAQRRCVQASCRRRLQQCRRSAVPTADQHIGCVPRSQEQRRAEPSPGHAGCVVGDWPSPDAARSGCAQLPAAGSRQSPRVPRAACAERPASAPAPVKRRGG